jgi:orotate phosphoribosyltransferase
VRLVQRVRQAATAEALHEQQRVEVVLVVALGGVLAARAAAEQLLQLLRRGAASERLPEQLVEARHLVVGQQLEDALCPVAELARDLGRFG